MLERLLELLPKLINSRDFNVNLEQVLSLLVISMLLFVSALVLRSAVMQIPVGYLVEFKNTYHGYSRVNKDKGEAPWAILLFSTTNRSLQAKGCLLFGGCLFDMFYQSTVYLLSIS